MTETCRLYSTYLSFWYPLLTPVADYEKESAIFTELFLSHNPGINTMLELGCGAGHNAFYLKNRFSMTLTDLSPEMLSLSKKLNPECEHLQGDMRTLKLNRSFDAVFIHDAISYITSARDLLQTFKTAFNHCAPGGCALIVPDYFKDTFKPGTAYGGTDDNGRGMRYLEWSHTPDPDGSIIIKDFALMLKDEMGHVQVEYDRHLIGLFSKADWISMLRQTGFDAEIISVPYHAEGMDELLIVYAQKK